MLDLLDAPAVRRAVLASQPEAVVHQATALSGLRDFKHFDRSYAQTSRLRTEGTHALLAAAREAGVRRFVAQSFASARYARTGGPVKTEDDPLDPDPVPAMRQTSAAMRHLDEAVTAAGGVARLFAGEAAVMMGTESRGAANAKAKRELGWQLRHPSRRAGFAAAYASEGAGARPRSTPFSRVPEARA